MSKGIPTPQIAHLTQEDYDHVYEPAEDSFVLLDALEIDVTYLRGRNPILAAEIGSGSGIVSVFLTTLLGSTGALILSTDINHRACSVTLRTGRANGVLLDPIWCDLLSPLSRRVQGSIDLLVFNPPYVPTNDQESTTGQAAGGIGGSWAGGDRGMEVTSNVLEQVPNLLSPMGTFYLVAVEQNRPDMIMSQMSDLGLTCEVVLKRRAGRELLSVIRAAR